MTDQPTIARKIVSFAAPTEDELVYFGSLPPEEQRALLQAEIDKGFTGGLGSRSFDEIVAEARARAEASRGVNG
jgi:hypothetical protein